MNVIKDHHYNWHKPFKALKHLIHNCWQRITQGWCDWDLMNYDEYLIKNMISALTKLEDKMWEEGGERVDYRAEDKETERLPITKLCDKIYIAREQLKASQDRTITWTERRELRDKALKTISYYFDNLWW